MSREPLDAHMFWIDEDIRRETQQAMKEGKSFGEALRIYDHYRSTAP